MKYIFPVLLFCSCKPSKSDLVNAQRSAMDSVEYYQSCIQGEKYKIEYHVKDSMNFATDIENRPFIKQMIESYLSSSNIDGKLASLRRKEIHYKEIYDSLEFELKKY